MAKRRRQTASEQLRQFIGERDESLAEIGRQTGVRVHERGLVQQEHFVVPSPSAKGDLQQGEWFERSLEPLFRGASPLGNGANFSQIPGEQGQYSI